MPITMIFLVEDFILGGVSSGSCKDIHHVEFGFYELRIKIFGFWTKLCVNFYGLMILAFSEEKNLAALQSIWTFSM
jgi:hypothetical protein